MQRGLVAVAMLAISALSTSLTVEPPEPVAPPEPTVEVINRVDCWDEEYRQYLIDATYLTVLANSIAPDSDEYCKLAIMQCVINRVHTAGFPNTIEDVCTQPGQWSTKCRGAAANTDTAKDLLAKYGDTFVLEIPRNCVFFDVLDDGVSFKPSLDSEETTFIPFRRTTCIISA